MNLEYANCDEADIWSDGQALPFRSCSVDLVYCTGVLEHVPDPMCAAREIHRVLKKGGRVLACVPFLQPLHNEPQHFFNASCFGMEKLFELFPDKLIWSGGDFEGTVSWIAQAAGIEARANPEDWQNFCALMRKFDSLLPRERLKYVASVNWVDAVKH
nr:class I SAM-dependent methyltransferase [Variovorax sp. OV329]